MYEVLWQKVGMVVFTMAQETIEAIRSAELAAEQSERDAAAQCEGILAEAQKQANELYNKMIREAKEKAGSGLETAQRQGDSLAADALRQAENEMDILRKISMNKEQAAVQLILSELV
jgi:vacuolar-type H+-ATPase subunit H